SRVRAAGQHERRRQYPRGECDLGMGEGIHTRGGVAFLVRHQPDQSPSDHMKARRLVAGVAIAALYVVVAQLSFPGGLVPTRPLDDGTGPPPKYRWVKPPAELAQGNIAPSSGAGATTIGAKESPAYSVNTDDGQA